jgi:hypothetical protein
VCLLERRGGRVPDGRLNSRVADSRPTSQALCRLPPARGRVGRSFAGRASATTASDNSISRRSSPYSGRPGVRIRGCAPGESNKRVGHCRPPGGGRLRLRSAVGVSEPRSHWDAERSLSAQPSDGSRGPSERLARPTSHAPLSSRAGVSSLGAETLAHGPEHASHLRRRYPVVAAMCLLQVRPEPKRPQSRRTSRRRRAAARLCGRGGIALLPGATRRASASRRSGR